MGACSKQDPILPGDRESIFGSTAVAVAGKEIATTPVAVSLKTYECSYTQDSSNVIWDGENKIFSGFPTSNCVKSDQKPVSDGKHIYAGLTTGELIKVNPKTRNVEWVADIYRESNLTGGAAVLDIIAPIVLHENHVYVGGLGDAFCKINKSNGTKRWCAYISVGIPFELTNSFAFVVSTDKHLNAINLDTGEIYWRTAVKKAVTPVLRDDIIIVGRQGFRISDGSKKDL